MNAIASRVARVLARLRGNEDGMTAIEYALIAGAIATALIAVLLILGEDVGALFEATSGTR